MEFTFIDDGIDAVIIDNYYTDNQIQNIFKELQFLTCSDVMTEDNDKLEAAVDLNGNYITNKAGVWLDHVYKNWRHSHLMRYMFDNLVSTDIKSKILEHNSLYKMLYHCNYRGHLLSYYENTGYYSRHTDSAVFTILNYFNREPKKFDGGLITLHSSDKSKKAEIETRNNRVILISSCTEHEVSPILMDTDSKFSGNGRYCMSCFASVVNPDSIKDDNKL